MAAVDRSGLTPEPSTNNHYPRGATIKTAVPRSGLSEVGGQDKHEQDQKFNQGLTTGG